MKLSKSVCAIAFASSALAACGGTNGYATTPISVPPTAIPTSIPTPIPIPSVAASASPAGIPTFTLPQSVGGSQIPCMLSVGGSTYAFVPGNVEPSGNVVLAEVLIAQGDSIVTSARRRVSNPAFSIRAKSAESTFGGSPTIALNPTPDECAADPKNGDLYLINVHSAAVSVVHVDPASLAMSLLATYTTDATASLNFNRGNATTFGVVFDPIDGDVIYANSKGYEVYSSARSATPNAKVKQISVEPAQDFGYDPVTDRIWSPSNIGGTIEFRLIDVRSGNSWAVTPPFPGVVQPGQGTIDTSDDVAVSLSDVGVTVGLADLGTAALDSPVAGEFSVANSQVTTLDDAIEGAGAYVQLDMAVDPVTHLALVDSPGVIGAMQLPAAGGSLAAGDYVFDSTDVPGSPLVQYVQDEYPHSGTTFDLGSSGPYGLLSVIDTSIAAEDSHAILVIDLRKLLAVPRSSISPRLITNDSGLVTEGVVYPIGI